MKKRKLKFLTTLSLGVLTVLTLAACSSTEKKATKKIVDTDTTATSTTTKTKESKAPAKKTKKVTIAKQELVNQNGITITATEYTHDDIWGDGIKLVITNTSQQNLTVGCDALIVNNYMLSDLFSADVAAGKTANETMYLSSSALEAAGISSVGQIEMYFRVYDTASFDDVFKTDVVTIQTSAFKDMDTTPNDTGKELYNQGGIRIVGKTVDEDSFWGSAILLYIENTSGVNVGIQCDNMSINGFMMDPLFSSEVYAGKKAIDDITLLDDDLKANNIKSIDTVELQFHIFNLATMETIADSAPITFSAK